MEEPAPGRGQPVASKPSQRPWCSRCRQQLPRRGRCPCRGPLLFALDPPSRCWHRLPAHCRRQCHCIQQQMAPRLHRCRRRPGPPPNRPSPRWPRRRGHHNLQRQPRQPPPHRSSPQAPGSGDQLRRHRRPRQRCRHWRQNRRVHARHRRRHCSGSTTEWQVFLSPVSRHRQQLWWQQLPCRNQRAAATQPPRLQQRKRRLQRSPQQPPRRRCPYSEKGASWRRPQSSLWKPHRSPMPPATRLYGD
mmetsp:Transcript_101135/g.324891  ORF Transcript_101135/g.324891 Transcript_101135/m.324891 type:complete len:246 (-) Transcript_101135:248-985(-)